MLIEERRRRGPCTDVLHQARKEQKTVQGKERYKIRAGIESTTFEAVLAHSLRKSRYCGMAKTSLQHQLTGAAINLVRINAWLNTIPVVHWSKTGWHAACASPRLLVEQDLGDRSAGDTWLKHESWGVAGPPRGRTVPLVDDGAQCVEVSPYK